jgi:hypothetical protein
MNHYTKSFNAWVDRYITKIDSMYVCWDERGEYIGHCDCIEKARELVNKYIKDRWETQDVGC